MHPACDLHADLTSAQAYKVANHGWQVYVPDGPIHSINRLVIIAVHSIFECLPAHHTAHVSRFG